MWNLQNDKKKIEDSKISKYKFKIWKQRTFKIHMKKDTYLISSHVKTLHKKFEDLEW
jgi:hypothetical protein